MPRWFHAARVTSLLSRDHQGQRKIKMALQCGGVTKNELPADAAVQELADKVNQFKMSNYY